MGGSYRRSRKRKLSGYILLLLGVVLLGCGLYYWQTVVCPAMDSIAQIKARAILTQVVNEAMREQFSEERDAVELLDIKTNNEGSIEMVQSNSKAINSLVTELAKEIQSRYAEMDGLEIQVPLGSLLGSKVLSQTGPSVEMKILPMSVSGMDFRTEFETQGINQTKYKVYVILESRAKVIAPFSDTTLELKTTILIAEAVILGKVPQSYVMVPEEDLLDVTQE